MQVNYDAEKLRSALDDFRQATGIEIGILKPDLSPAGGRTVQRLPYCEAVQRVTGEAACHMSDEELLKKCRESKKAEMTVCHAGLVNVAVPLFYDDVIIGYIIFGCLKTPGYTQARPDLSRYPEGERERIGRYYESIPVFSDARIESTVNVAIMLAKYILLEKLLEPSFDDNIEKAIRYVSENLDGDLSVSAIARGAGVSKSALYRSFHSSLGVTVSEYVRLRRIEYAIELMHSGAVSVEELAQRSGFASASYFSREFKKQTGYSPAKYKRQM
ncbi:MAG: PocR ligand-binding domain-containing protein [Clostridia bacterium]|nr:PocR ligand-binding domain-containing protein [Clostridia bacterium]